MSPPSLEQSHPLGTKLHESLALLLSHMLIALRLHLQKSLSYTNAMYVQHWKLGRKKNIRKNIKAYIQKNDCWYSGFYLWIDCSIIVLKQTSYLYFWFFWLVAWDLVRVYLFPFWGWPSGTGGGVPHISQSQHGLFPDQDQVLLWHWWFIHSSLGFSSPSPVFPTPPSPPAW